MCDSGMTKAECRYLSCERWRHGFQTPDEPQVTRASQYAALHGYVDMSQLATEDYGVLGAVPVHLS
jgi:hypothetical protein